MSCKALQTLNPTPQHLNPSIQNVVRIISALDKQKEHMNHHRAQRDPQQGKESVNDAVIADLNARRVIGTEKYGTELKTHNGRNALIDAYQEALDLACYLKQAIMEQEDGI